MKITLEAIAKAPVAKVWSHCPRPAVFRSISMRSN